MAFLGSMSWMDLAADEVVGVTVALGTIFNFDRSMVRYLASLPYGIRINHTGYRRPMLV